MFLPDVLFIGIVLVWVFLWIHRRAAKKNHLRQLRAFLFALWGYHLVIAYVYYRYLMHQGGDSLRYWELRSLPLEQAAGWLAHWGLGTAFLQWVNYPFSQGFALGFLSGTVGYAMLSFVGFLLLAEWIADRFLPVPSARIGIAGMLLLFLPNAHFWTAGVGKEAFLWLGLILVLVGADAISHKWGYLVLGLLLSLMVRPIQGLVLCVSVFGVLPFHPALRQHRRYLVPLAAALILGIGVYRWIQGSLVYGFHLRWIGELLHWQQQYLASFGGTSSVPMSDYSLVEKLATVLFRPFIWEAAGFWTLAASLENTVLLLGMLGGGWAWFRTKGRLPVPVFYRISLVYGLLLSLLFAFTLTNLGILMRMKSIYSLLVLCFFYERIAYYWSNRTFST
ncbi:hypothetical protein [Cyclobacterium xiamenense]|uniref:hypothetical protein n=1 Tax=Cyclobacterium xiamenense TaxID=1297121 RepID=UPI0012BA2676|nr:hypothetical protein [Cyclobacterium xiamenense]